MIEGLHGLSNTIEHVQIFAARDDITSYYLKKRNERETRSDSGLLAFHRKQVREEKTQILFRYL